METAKGMIKGRRKGGEGQRNEKSDIRYRSLEIRRKE